MKQIVQSYKTGEVKLRNVPVPLCSSKRSIVRTCASLVSIGTERSVIDLGRKSLAGKAAARPDLVRRVWDKAKKEGLLKTYREVLGRLDTPTPLGYSSSGVIEECGISATEFSRIRNGRPKNAKQVQGISPGPRLLNVAFPVARV